MKRHMIKVAILSALALLVSAQTSRAVAPTKEAIRQWIAEGVYHEKLSNWAAFKAAGGCAPNEHSPLETLRALPGAARGTSAVDTINVIVILAEFTDWLASDQNVAGTLSGFDSLLFSDRDTDPVFNPTGSMTDYYFEISYGTVYIRGDVFGWYMMPKTYEYYVGTDDGLSRSGELAGAAVDAAEAAGVDFSPYANGDQWVDGVIVVHSGAGAETGAYGIWSHMSSMPQRYYDGVAINLYTMNPEEQGIGLTSMGVFCHEWGHILGLADLYDLNSDSPGDGLGDWSLMAGGSWNGNGQTPAHPDAFTRAQAGFVDIVWLESNLYQVELPQVEHNRVVYGMKDDPLGPSPQYWLVENRQRVGFDAELPGAGLCIYHVDEAVPVQNNRFRYRVALEQADGRNDLTYTGGSDAGDSWPGSTNNRDFHDQSVPDSKNNFGVTTEVGVQMISNSDSLMYADLDVYFSRTWVELSAGDSLVFLDPVPGGDGNGVLEAGETVEFYGSVINRMREAYTPLIHLAVDVDGVAFIENDVPLGGSLLTGVDVGNITPITFSLPVDFESIIARFTLTVTADSVMGEHDSTFVTGFEFDQSLGAPQVLIVDDDNGQTLDQRFSTGLTDLRLPSETWDKSISSPTGGDLLAYRSVIWHTGKNDGSGGSITAGDVAALTEFLDGGGSLFLSSLTAASQLHTLDSAFMADYLHATLAGTNKFGLGFMGIDGNEVTDGSAFTYYGNAPINPMHDVLDAYTGGQEAFYLADEYGSGNFGDCAVTYSGAYRTVFATFGAEFISEGNEYLGFQHRDTLLSRVLDFFNRTYPYVSTVFVEGDDVSQIVDHTPTFGWSVIDTGSLAQTEYELEVGSDNEWTTAEMWAPGVTASADTFVAYAGAPLLDGETYYARLRASNGTLWSEWSSTSLHMNTLPLAPQLASPSDGRFTGNPPPLFVWGGSDAESTSLWYQFEVYSDEGLGSVVTTSPDVGETADSTAWLVDVTLDELARYWWRARTSDGAEYSAWSDSGTFVVNSAYEPPTGTLIVPSMSEAPCDTSCLVQPFVVQASKPLTKATIPLRIPDDVEICEVSFDGLITESWDLSTAVIESDSAFLVVRLDNSLGYQLDLDTPAVLFEVHFTAPIPCMTSEFVSWDTARYDVSTDVLSFTDTMETFGPEFDVGQDSTEIVGYTPGEVDKEASVDIGDLTFMIAYLFIDGEAPCNFDAADMNSDCVGPDIGDLTYLIQYLFVEGADPLCGCVVAGAPAAPQISPDITVQAVQEGGYTEVVLNSSVELRGVQLELSGSGGDVPVNLQPGTLDLVAGRPGNPLNLAVLDLDGPHVIKAGSVRLLRLEGDYEIVSGLVSDLAHRVLTPSIATAADGPDLPDTYGLSQNYPNPFNPSTDITFALPVPSRVKLEVFNILGQEVVTLVDEARQAGYHTITWDGASGQGHQVASGVYFYRLVTDEFSQTKKMILLK
ncbi:MAG TPA: M6 family metalloprotease domain-containing protein [Acidobacteriota bacterium]|nr:M6 family metalloprotease domain-containing protein [Acidobacteriota bacterium]